MDTPDGLLCVRDTTQLFRVFDANPLSYLSEFASDKMPAVGARVVTTVRETDGSARAYHVSEETHEQTDVTNQYPDLPSPITLQSGELGGL